MAVFASDALSSVAYATQEIFVVLIAAGAASLSLSLPIAISIVVLLIILTLSYRQTIFAYPSGGGAYIVAKENIGEVAAQIAGAALLTDYILTVAVSVSSGVDQITSAIPILREHQVAISLALVFLMTFVNLRGVKESGQIFALPTYFFVSMAFLTLGVGFYRMFTHSFLPIEGVQVLKTTAEPLVLFLILRAFSSGCTALTGVEAISNGITAFQEPKSHNAATTMSYMSLILGVMFVGITYLAVKSGVMPSETETVISQLGRTVFGRGLFYSLLIGSTTVILIMAANTSYADFPRLCALHAGDGFLPRQLTYRSGRLVYKWGITSLAAVACILLVIFNANTTALIPLYAIGVFLSFTLSQSGMVVHWLKSSRGSNPDPHWHWKIFINALGAVASCLVMMVFAVTKFSHGAWITVLLIPTLVWIFFRIHGHYKRVSKELGFGEHFTSPVAHQIKTIILVDSIHRGTMRMIEFAKSLGQPWIAIHVNYDDERAAQVRSQWINEVGDDKDLVVISSPYRLLLDPIKDFVISTRDTLPKDAFVHVISGQVIIEDPLARLLHSRDARGILNELQFYDRIITTAVPYQL